MGGWVPDPGGLMRVTGMLLDGSSGSNEAQESAYRSLRELAEHAEFDLYLAYVLNSGGERLNAEQNAVVRQSAGLLLKNNLQRSYSTMNDGSTEYVHTELLRAVGDNIMPIRQVASIAISTLVSKDGMQRWPELLTVLMSYVRSNDETYQEGAILVLCKLCEDALEQLQEDPDEPLDRIIPELLRFVLHDKEHVRLQVLASVSHMITPMPSSLRNNLPAVLQALSYASDDRSDSVRASFCGAVSRLLETDPDVLKDAIDNIIPYMIRTSQSPNEDLALEACEFWLVYPQVPGARERLFGYLPQLVLVLLENMIFSESDPDVIDADEDCSVPDRPEEIRPHFHTPRSIGAAEQGNAEGDSRDDEASNWTVRKSSAAALDILSVTYGNDLLPLLLPVVQDRLGQSQRWAVRESAVLALGACSEGCMSGMEPYLPNLVRHLVTLLEDGHHLVRSIVCWTLSRYSRWIVNERTPFGEGPLVEASGNSTSEANWSLSEHVLRGLLKVLLDRNKRVQAAACSALACFEEELGTDLIPAMGLLLTAYSRAFTCFQRKNQLILYDAIGTMAECVGSALAQEEHINILMPPLISKWNELSDNDLGLLPLLECLTVVLKSLGKATAVFAPPIFSRCILIAKQTFSEAAPRQNEESPLEGEFVICSLDLISGIVEALGDSLEAVVDTSGLQALVVYSLGERRADVRQSAFALLGDLAHANASIVPPMIPEFIDKLPTSIDYRFENVCNNAIWSLGEVAMMLHRKGLSLSSIFGGGMDAVLTQLGGMLQSPDATRSILENTAISLGRLGLAMSSSLAPAVGDIIRPMCLILRNVRDSAEKTDASHGLCAMIRLNPSAVVPSLVYFCDLIASWNNPAPALSAEFMLILESYKSTMGSSSWALYYSSIPEPLRQILTERYNL